jgi:hypothetical protein
MSPPPSPRSSTDRELLRRAAARHRKRCARIDEYSRGVSPLCTARYALVFEGNDSFWVEDTCAFIVTGLARSGRWRRTPHTSPGTSSIRVGCPVGWPDMNRTPVSPCAARSLPRFGSAPGPRKGVPASSLRFDPGTPFLDQHIQRCLWQGQLQSADRERAGSNEFRAEDVQEVLSRSTAVLGSDRVPNASMTRVGWQRSSQIEDGERRQQAAGRQPRKDYSRARPQRRLPRFGGLAPRVRAEHPR